MTVILSHFEWHISVHRDAVSDIVGTCPRLPIEVVSSKKHSYTPGAHRPGREGRRDGTAVLLAG